MTSRIKVLVVDDSALVRKIISDALERDPAIEVVGTANNGKTAVFKSFTLDPDVITMDIEMPIMNGLDALGEIIRTNPKPVIMMSVLTQHGAEATFRALELGAVDFIPKPSSVLSLSVDDISALLIAKVKAVAGSRINFRPRTERDVPDISRLTPAHRERYSIENYIRLKPMAMESTSRRIVAIGTSTGGPSALLNVFSSLPENFPSPVLVVQHMPEGFTRAFAERLNSNSALSVKEAEDGDRVMPGCGYIAPGHSHMLIERRQDGEYIVLSKSDKVSGHRPSIDVLFISLAEQFGPELIGVIMTGMGRDGAEGLMKIRKKGGFTLAQNEATSVVYGMHRVAVEIGAVHEEAPIEEISKKIVEHL